MFSRFIHVVTCIRISFPLKVERYSLVYIYTTICFPHHLLMGLLAIVNMYILYRYVQKSVWVPAFSYFGVYIEVEWLDYMAILCLIYEELLYCLPQCLHYTTFPPAMHEGSIFFTSSLTFGIFCFWNNSYFNGYKVIFYNKFDLYSNDQ